MTLCVTCRSRITAYCWLLKAWWTRTNLSFLLRYLFCTALCFYLVFFVCLSVHLRYLLICAFILLAFENYQYVLFRIGLFRYLDRGPMRPDSSAPAASRASPLLLQSWKYILLQYYIGSLGLCWNTKSLEEAFVQSWLIQNWMIATETVDHRNHNRLSQNNLFTL